MRKYLSFLSRPEDLSEKLNTFALDGWKLFSTQPALEKQNIWQVIMTCVVKNKKIVED